ncbi:uncharacterized protein EI97DRAFT_504890 [Westerdykella ornata]|uniref:Zn(2)-C6 fungal-type domain-containing protein n=1 Tax=Westerdykella ornata TaxID=318751 RepID=A0A6A6J577_WESOR|nr:uncharacterized protein EI97DRAFT_504890 [Westerdykella ornata]KAF2271542.1 hypothetical protein EI97DRAFT_504890 [Westerdykella ornata]
MELNEAPSSCGFEEEPPGSPKRKKVRAKYASKACVACRRSKLKCSGDNPCQRCMDNGRRCFYSEDQTAAEALQNLSRPSLPQPSSSIAGNGLSSNGTTRNILPRSDPMPRRASDASSFGTSMDARMARMEGMMEALLRERGIVITPRGSTEREAPPMGEYHVHEDAINPNLPPPVRAQPTYRLEQHQLQDHQSTSASHSIAVIKDSISVEVPFTVPTEYRRYLDHFFEQVYPFYPCIDPVPFREQGGCMLSSLPIQKDKRLLLALHYVMFALVDVSESNSPNETMPGWYWYQTAETLIGQEVLHSSGGLVFIQYLILKAIYLTYIDKPNLSYNTIGLACRTCFRMGLHDKKRWGRLFGPDSELAKRIFWTLYYVDRRVALSCGRPYGIHDSDIDVEWPKVDIKDESSLHLEWMIKYAKKASALWDKRSFLNSHETVAVSAKMMYLDCANRGAEEQLEKYRSGGSTTLRKMIRLALDLLSLNNFRLFFSRHRILFFSYSAHTVGDVDSACRLIILTTTTCLDTMDKPELLGYHMASSLGSVILTMGILRQKRNHFTDWPVEEWDSLYHDAVALLERLKPTTPLAWRVERDLKAPVILAHRIDPKRCPYRHLDFMQQMENDGFEGREGEDGELELSMESRAGEYGVPWL